MQDLRAKDYTAALLSREGVLLGTRPDAQVVGSALGFNGCRGPHRQMAIMECERRGITREQLATARLVPCGDDE